MAQRALILASALSLTTAVFAVDSRPAASIEQAHLHPDLKTAAQTGGTPDRVLIGNEFVPRRVDLPNTLIVPPRQTVELPEDARTTTSRWLNAEVSRAHDTRLRFTHLLVLVDGTLDVGTQTDPIPCNRSVEFIVRDVPIDTTKDPFSGAMVWPTLVIRRG